MTRANVMALLATLDTKGPETAYVRDRLRDHGLKSIVIDCGILGEPRGIEPDVSSDEVAQAGGASLDELRAIGTRGRAVAAMRTMLANFVEGLYRRGEIDGGIGLGSAEGAVMAASALMRLPVGVPKIIVSPIASGRHEFGPLVGTRDMMVVHSVVDILAHNEIAWMVFDNVAASMAGMARVRASAGHAAPDGMRGAPGPPTIGITMLGNTTRAGMACQRVLHEHGLRTMVFHSNGVGGPAMEELAREGHLDGVIDLTTNEVTDPLVGGIHDGGPDRMRVISKLGLPQVVGPGCIDFAVFEPSRIPDALRDRPSYDHNPEFRLVRTSAQEMITIAGIFAERLAPSTGPLAVAVPTRGLSIPNTPGGPFWDPDADAGFLRALREQLRNDGQLHTFDHHVNDPAFGREVAGVFLDIAMSSLTTATPAITASAVMAASGS